MRQQACTGNFKADTGRRAAFGKFGLTADLRHGSENHCFKPEWMSAFNEQP
jgi:hypothetical protein